ncbi:MAG: transferrin-binding protein-like solute binding protein, partial [Alphaproteobacteria bacterium]|nr:transferrin-binding protein-like solute binding protein [Alphaproteobacteria bacterium]
LTVGLKDATEYTRYQDDLWNVNASELQIDRQITPTRITSSAVALTFGGTAGAITGATAYADADYAGATADRSAIFGFNSNYMAYISWGKDESLDTSNVGLTQTVTDIDGMMITGIETDNDDILNTDTINFTGKGAGVYGTKTTGYNTAFDVTAVVNFTASNVNISTSNTACTSDCNGVTVPSYLDFTTGAINYNSVNSISTALTLDSTLSGTLDARFYGDVVQEFGGTFALAEADTRYYYGAFGAKRPDYVFSIHAPKTFNDNGLTSFNDNARVVNNVGTIDNALQISTAVEITQQKSDKTIANNNITGAIVEFDYDMNGAFADGDDGLILYFADKKYSTTNGSGYQDYIFDTSPDAGDADMVDSIALSKATTYFTNVPDYMALVLWNIDNTTYESHGFAMVGFETNLADISSTVSATFTGEGQGHYYTATASDTTQFDVSATVDFGGKTVTLSSENTCKYVSFSCAGAMAYLDVTANNLSYIATTNAITGTMATAGGGGNATLSGAAEARFYGNTAQELGGTFSLTNNGAGTGYAGYFGASRDEDEYIVSLDKPIIFNSNNLTGFNDENRKDKNDNALKIASIVELSRSNSIATNPDTRSILGAVVEFDYKTSNTDFATHLEGQKNGLRLHFNDKKYFSTSGSSNENRILASASAVDGGDVGDVFGRFWLSKKNDHNDNDLFGFDPGYMAVIHWQRDDAADIGYNGYGITGFETDGNIIPTLNNAFIFNGKGRGRYASVDAIFDVYFDVVAHVDFVSHTVNLTSDNTCFVSDASFCMDNESQQQYALNVTGTLNYTAGMNDITGTIQTVGSNDRPQLSGTANARFYGTGDDAAKELGGTFNLVNAMGHGYVGWFGTDVQAARLIAMGADIATTRASWQSDNYQGFASFDAVETYLAAQASWTSKTLTLSAIGVQATHGTTYIRPDTATAWDDNAHESNENVVISKIGGPFVTIKYSGNSGGGGSRYVDDLIPYVGSKNIGSDEFGDGSSFQIYEYKDGKISDAKNAGRESHIRLSHDIKSTGTTTIDNSSYMTMIYWSETLASTSLDNSKTTDTLPEYEKGYMVAGFETTNIPTSGTSVSFTGSGSGSYQSTTSPLMDSFVAPTVTFDVTATVNFSGRKVRFQTANTGKHCGAEANCTDILLPNLNFDTGQLPYTAGTNNISGAVSVDGMNGSVEARFYGPNAQEVGGTFRMSKSYYDHYTGHFGAKQ